jgi:hypothetical protein
MSGLVEHVERWEIAQLEATMDEDLQCEVPDHADPAWGRIHSGPGEFLAVLACGKKAVVCRPLRDALVAQGMSTCTEHIVHPISAASFIEL